MLTGNWQRYFICWGIRKILMSSMPFAIGLIRHKKTERKNQGMELHELLKYFRESDTIGENPEAISLMRYYSRQAHSTRTHNIRPPIMLTTPVPLIFGQHKTALKFLASGRFM